LNIKQILPQFYETLVFNSFQLQNLYSSLQLGVHRIFSDDDADLSGISGEKGDLLVNEILQKTFIDVSEEGVEAAAATDLSKLVFY
jgi:serine protease inhibitor